MISGALSETSVIFIRQKNAPTSYALLAMVPINRTTL
jgi:hypothetical protein